jgi:hypothetical protein
MVWLIAIPPVLIILSSLVLGRAFQSRFPARWWLLRLGLVPLIFLGLACYVMVTPTPIPDNYDPDIHGDSGRLDFLAIMVWGFVLPTIYVAISFPVSIGYALLKRQGRLQPD